MQAEDVEQRLVRIAGLSGERDVCRLRAPVLLHRPHDRVQAVAEHEQRIPRGRLVVEEHPPHPRNRGGRQDPVRLRSDADRRHRA